ncbi:MAG: STAS-like domain-containing protein [Methanotrichaceae archaeon]
MNGTQIHSTSAYLAEIKAVTMIGIGSLYDTLQQCCSIARDAPKTIGLRFDNRTSSQLKEQFKELQPQSTNVEDVYDIDMGTGVMGPVEVIRVRDLIGSEFCLSSDGGQKLYGAIRPALLNGKRVHLSFRNISDISSAFLDSAIGELFNGEIPKADIIENLSIRGLSEDDSFILSRVIDRAEDFFRDPKKFDSLLGYDNY